MREIVTATPAVRADVQRIEFLLDVPLVEILESDLALPVPYIAYFRPAEYGKAVRPFLNDVVSVDYGDFKAVDRRGNRGHFGSAAFRSIIRKRFLKGDVATVYRIGVLRLQEVAFEVYPHEKRAEITYLVVILYFVDDCAVKNQVGDKEKRRGESSLDTEVHPAVVAVDMLGTFRFIRSGYNRQLSPRECGEGQQTNPEK